MKTSTHISYFYKVLADYYRKPFRWATLFSIAMALAVSLVMLDTFVIPRAGSAITAETVDTGSSSQASESGENLVESSDTGDSAAVITSTSYKDANIQITIETMRRSKTTVYVADIQVSAAAYLKTAFAKNTYGRNIKETTSVMAEANRAILAINGDYYGFRDAGFVLRNGVLYRNTARKSGSDEALAIDSIGNFSIINESATDAKSLVDTGIRQVLSFGPALIKDGTITVNAGSEVGQSMSSNPRTAIGQISALHYIMIVSDGRSSLSTGLSLLELAQEFKDRGCITAYNLDGGGSSTLWFNGQVINQPTDGRSIAERSVSDIVYFGY